MRFEDMIRRPETSDHRIDRNLAAFKARTLGHISLKELHKLIDDLREETRVREEMRRYGKGWMPR